MFRNKWRSCLSVDQEQVSNDNCRVKQRDNRDSETIFKKKKTRNISKRIVAAMMLAALLVGMSGCSGNEEHSGTDPSTQNTDYDVSTTPNSTDVESKNDTAGQILINEIPIRDIIGMSAEEIIEIFGQPDAYNECASVK